MLDGGDRLVHLDLHPMNVMITPTGPIVIDWPNAARGDPLTDVAVTLVLLTCPRHARLALLNAAVKPVRAFLGADVRARVTRAARSTSSSCSRRELKSLDANLSADRSRRVRATRRGAHAARIR